MTPPEILLTLLRRFGPMTSGQIRGLLIGMPLNFDLHGVYFTLIVLESCGLVQRRERLKMRIIWSASHG